MRRNGRAIALFVLLVFLGAALGFLGGLGWPLLAQRGTPPPRTDARPRPVTPRGELTASERQNIRIFQKASPSVAYITTLVDKEDFFSFDVRRARQGTGSGFVWDELGHIVTNYHVIQGADAAQVTLFDQSTYDARLVGGSAEKDLAVLRIGAPSSKLKPFPVGTSFDLAVGQEVYAIGNPFGLDQTLTNGIISALGREIESPDNLPIRDVIQTDAAINPGNSGGPLLDSSGRLIGVNAAIVSSSGSSAGVGFAIPVDTVNWVVPELISKGRIIRPGLGITAASDSVSQRLGVEGVAILRTTRGGPAEQAGLKPTKKDRNGRAVLGDVIVAIGGEKVTSTRDLYIALEKHRVGETVKVTLLRDKRRVDVSVRLAEER
jgi:S1-C subfamily serine protease